MAATIYVENGGYLYFSSSSTLTTTANITISAGGVVFVNGSLQSPFPANNNTLITINRFGRLEWNGSLSVYYKIAGAGGIRCCGASSITRIVFLVSSESDILGIHTPSIHGELQTFDLEALMA